MKTLEQITEEFLRGRLASIAPPRSLFVSVLNSVTEYELNRYTNESLGKDRSYTLSTIFSMKKPLIIGAVVVAIGAAGGAWLFGSSAGTPVAMTDPTAVQPTSAPTETAKPTENPTPQIAQTAPAAAVAPVDARTSVDTLTSGIENSESADAATVAAESNDGTTLSADLNTYSEVKTSSYDNTI
jgi:hypothetical protein